MDDAEARGRRDYFADYDRTSNPYPRASSLFDDWVRGWDSARESRED